MSARPFLADPDFTLWQGDVRDVLPTLAPESVDCALTSPPFYGLRDYGTGSWEGGDPDCDHLAPPSGGPNPERYSAGGGEMWRAANDKSYRDLCGKCGARRVDRQIGLEASPDEWCAELVTVFREVRRILRPSGTLWIEIGSSYASGGTRPSQSPQPLHAPSCGSDGTEPPDSHSPGSAYRDHDDGCPAETPNRHVRNENSSQPHEQSEPRDALTDRGSERRDFSLDRVDSLPFGAPASTTPSSSPRFRLPPPTDVSGHAGTHSLSPESQLSARTEACNDGTARRESERRSQDTDAGGTAWVDYKPKDLILQPFLLAEALRRDGWYLRQIIVWSRPNPMPESVRDRCATAHSYVLLLAKSRSYYFDAEAIAEPAEYGRRDWNGGTNFKGGDITRGHGGTSVTGGDPSAGRNARSVWSIPTEGFSEAHFATFPQALVERILKAGCPEWVCAKCGKPRERIVEKESRPNRSDNHGKHDGTLYRTVSGGVGNDRREVLGEAWSDCGCGAGFTPGVCLDPFMGSGTTALVARRLGRSAVGVELNADYCAMAAARTGQLSLLAEAPL